jgi:hypothetical protein
MPQYFKRAWDEPRGDGYHAWGTSVWYLEVDNDHYPVRQIEMYQSGDVLTYDQTHLADDYGMLGDQALEGEDEWRPFEITADEFEAAWHSVKPQNR